MILDYRGKPLPSAQMGFVPSKPVTPRGESKKPATADAIGWHVDHPEPEHLEE